MSSYLRLGAISVMMLVVLRIAVGWHFFYEGCWKYTHASYSAEAFLQQAKGPLAGQFQISIPDQYGAQRLDAELMKEAWQAFANEVAAHYGYTEQQQADANRLVDAVSEQHRRYLAGELYENPSDELDPLDVEKYLSDIKRWHDARKDPGVQGIPTFAKKHADERAALRRTAAPWLARVDKLDENLRYSVMALATPEQVSDQGGYSPPWREIDWVNFLTTYGLLAIGGCLMLGLFTRFASLCGAVFLLMVTLAQPALPWVFPQPHPSAGHALLINKEFIEMLLLFFLATTRVGRWGGLDFFVYTFVTRRLFGPKKIGKIRQ